MNNDWREKCNYWIILPHHFIIITHYTVCTAVCSFINIYSVSCSILQETEYSSIFYSSLSVFFLSNIH